MKIFISCLLLVFFAFHNATAVKFDLCENPSGELRSVEVSDCPNDEDVCILKSGTSIKISIVFVSKTAEKTVTAVVHGIADGVPYPFFLPEADGCTYGGLSCPLENGKSYKYSHDLDIKTSYPSGFIIVRWELEGDNKKDIICIDIPCEIR